MQSVVRQPNPGVIHVRLGERQVDLAWDDVDFSRISTDGQVRRAVAAALGVPPADLAGAGVYRQVDGNVTVRRSVGFG